MLLLPSIQWSTRADDWFGVRQLRLPCPATDLIRLVADAPGTAGSLIRTNPAILLFAAWHYHQQTALPVESWQTLERWADDQLLECLCEQLAGGVGAGSPACFQGKPKKVRRSVERMWCAVDSNSLTKSLVGFVAATTGDKKSSIGESFPNWFKLAPDRRPDARSLRTKFVSRAIKHWDFSDRSTRAADVYQILKFKWDALESQATFEQRLLNDKMAAMKQLAYGASHEINNPLANVATRAQNLLKSETNPDRRQKLATIYEQAMRAHEMISDMMLFANPPTLQRQPTDLRFLIAALLRDVEAAVSEQKALHEKRIEWSVRVAADIPSVLVDQTQLSVLLHSLVKNSMEAIESAGAIEMRVSQSADGAVSISVTDDGVGVSELAQQHLFDPFYSGREAGRGLGFGLSKAWRIAELHGATLIYDHEYAGGTRFVLELPLGDCGSVSDNTTDQSNAA